MSEHTRIIPANAQPATNPAYPGQTKGSAAADELARRIKDAGYTLLVCHQLTNLNYEVKWRGGEANDFPSVSIGDKVVFYEYEWRVGTITRVGDKTVSIEEKMENGYSISFKRVPSNKVFPATDTNVARVKEIASIKNEILRFTVPLQNDIREIVKKIEATGAQ